MILKPLAGYILVEPVDEEEVTASGLVMPDKEKEKPSKGKVISIGGILKEGNTTYYPPQGLSSGDIVVFHKWSGQDIKENQKELRLVHFKDLMGIYG